MIDMNIGWWRLGLLSMVLGDRDPSSLVSLSLIYMPAKISAFL
jgi:hypothetical protein